MPKCNGLATTSASGSPRATASWLAQIYGFGLRLMAHPPTILHRLSAPVATPAFEALVGDIGCTEDRLPNKTLKLTKISLRSTFAA